MSKIGNLLIEIPKGVQIEVKDNTVHVKGPKGELKWALLPEISLSIKDNQVEVKRGSELKKIKAFHGLSRALIYNMAIGVSEGYSKTLVLIWKGGKMEVKGKDFSLSVNFINKSLTPPPGIELTPVKTTELNIPGIERGRYAGAISVSGIDKQLVGQVAAKIRHFLPPEPYHGKGIRYIDEFVKTKSGKSGATV
ncbi:50S ribosomal protein L6 [bacterium]|nr:50S ribosomal protein L6 [bacterium]